MSDPFMPAYCAGLFDAKGTIAACAENRLYRVQVLLVSTDRPVLEWFQQQWGGQVYAQGVPRQATWARAHQLLWTSARDQRAVLTGLRPYLIIKRRAAELALEMLALPRDFRGRVLPEAFERRRELGEQLRAG